MPKPWQVESIIVSNRHRISAQTERKVHGGLERFSLHNLYERKSSVPLRGINVAECRSFEQPRGQGFCVQ